MAWAATSPTRPCALLPSWPPADRARVRAGARLGHADGGRPVRRSRPSWRRPERGEAPSPPVASAGGQGDWSCWTSAHLRGLTGRTYRTVWVGEPATTEQVRIYDVVAASQAAGVAAVRQESPRRHRQGLPSGHRRRRMGEQFVHGTGHGVGLDIHEAPSVASSSSDTLMPGHVVTVEPGVYLPGSPACASRTRRGDRTAAAISSPSPKGTPCLSFTVESLF